MAEPLDFAIINSFYHISPEGMDSPEFEIPAAQLLDAGTARSTLERLGAHGKCHGMEMPVSFLGMTMFNLCVTNLYFLARNDRFLQLRLDGMTFQFESHDDHFHLGYRLDALNERTLPPQGDEARGLAIDEAWRAMFKETVIPFIQSIAAAGGLKPDLIWNQFGGAVHSVIEYVRIHMPVPELLAGLDEQLGRLEALSPETFGRRRNPFVHKPRYIDNPWAPPDGQYIVRSSCCMYDRREGGEKCYNCPQMLPEEREARRRRIMAASGTE